MSLGLIYSLARPEIKFPFKYCIKQMCQIYHSCSDPKSLKKIRTGNIQPTNTHLQFRYRLVKKIKKILEASEYIYLKSTTTTTSIPFSTFFPPFQISLTLTLLNVSTLERRCNGLPLSPLCCTMWSPDVCVMENS